MAPDSGLKRLACRPWSITMDPEESEEFPVSMNIDPAILRSIASTVSDSMVVTVGTQKGLESIAKSLSIKQIMDDWVKRVDNPGLWPEETGPPATISGTPL